MEIGPFRLGELVVLISLIGGIVALIRTINRWMSRISHLLEDFLGEEERPGVAHRKGVLERLADHDEAIIRLDAEDQRLRLLIDEKDQPPAE